MARNKLEGLLILGFVISILGIVIWGSYQDIENFDEIVTWLSVLLFLVLAGFFARMIYTIIKNPNSLDRYQIKTKSFWGIVIIMLLFFTSQHYHEEITQFYELEDGDYADQLGIFNYIMPAFISAIVLITIAYQNQFSNYRRDYLNIVKKLEKNRKRLNKILLPKLQESDYSKIILKQNKHSVDSNDFWIEMREVSKMTLVLACILIGFGIILFLKMNSNDIQTGSDFTSFIINLVFSGAMFIVFWVFLHGSVNRHEDILLWLIDTDANFEVDIEELEIKINFNPSKE